LNFNRLGTILSYFVQTIRRHTWLWAFCLFLILPFLAFPELIFSHHTLYWTDLSWIHFPRHIFAAEEWLAGRVPLWDPYEDTGIPLLAESQVGVLYPLSVLFLTSLSPSLELSLFILIHFPLAAFFTFILARSLGQEPAAATIAGLAFGFGGFLMAQIPNLNIMTGTVWLPLILYAVIQATRRRSWPAAMLAGLPVALQIFTAQPQVVFYTLVVVSSYGLYRISADFVYGDNRRKRNVRYALCTALLVSIAVLSGLLLAAPQLLPTLELQQLSVRSTERGLDFLTKNSLPPVMALNLLLPSIFGNNVVGFKGGDPFQEVFSYVGLIPLLLVCFCWRQRDQKDAPFFFLLLIGAVLMTLGRYTPLYEAVIQHLPGFDLFRIPSRWLMVVCLAVAILAGYGLQGMQRKGLFNSALLGLWLAGLVIITTLGLAWLFRAELLAWSSTHLDEVSARLAATFLDHGFRLDPIYQEQRLLGGMFGLRIPVVLLITNIIFALGLFTLLARQYLTHRAFAMMVISVTAIDLVAAGGTTINPIKPAGWWWQLSGGAQYVLDHTQEMRVFPLGMGSEEATVSHLGQYFPSVYHIHSAGGHGSSLRIARYDTFLHKADPVQAIQVIGARHLLTLGQMGADVAATYPLVYSDETSFVYENPHPLPRAFIVHQAIQVESPAEALAQFQIRSIDPHHTVILEANTEAPRLSPVISTAPGMAKITAEQPHLIEIEANLAEAGYLVLLDTYYPGWIATDNGDTTPIYRANYIGRAVFLPAGDHTVRFEYRPLSFRLGLLLAGLMLVAITVVAFITGQDGLHTEVEASARFYSNSPAEASTPID
jgi:hypothetical protein